MRPFLGVERAFVLILSLLPVAAQAAGPQAARMVDVRMHVHPERTRLEFELDAPAGYAVAQHRLPGPGSSATEVVVRFDARGAYPFLQGVADMRLEQATRRGLIQSVRMERMGEGGVARIRLNTSHPKVQHALLGDPTRIVIDVGLAPPQLAELRLAKASPVGRPRRIEEPKAERERRKRLTRRPEEKRPARPLAVPLLGRPLVIGGEFEVAVGYDGDPRLGQREDDRAKLDQKLEIELFYALNPTLSLFAETQYQFRWDFHREDGRTGTRGVLERGEAWLHAARLGGTPFGLQLGRQNLQDEREWWWDENLDSVRLHYAGDRLEAQVAVGQELAPEALDEEFIDPEQDDVLRLLASASWRYARRHRLTLFLLAQRDRSRRESIGRIVAAGREDEVDANLTWLGLRATGGWRLGRLGRLDYWWDAGGVRGRERVADFDDFGDDRLFASEVKERRVRGWALDAGLTWATPLPGSPSLSLGYAIGSGDADPGDASERAFRQTGLHDNESKLGGETRVRYYGELFDPELSNLHVATAALGLPLFDASGLTFLYHYYHQVYASRSLRSAGIRARPAGKRASLGHGLDLVLGLEEWEHLRLEAVASVFRAGAAYAEREGRLAYGAGLKLEFGF